jgi:hypothetical protein
MSMSVVISLRPFYHFAFSILFKLAGGPGEGDVEKLLFGASFSYASGEVYNAVNIDS